MLPTREEVKEAIENIKLAISDTHTGRIQNIRASVQVALKVLEAHSSGTLIEARTEGEIDNIVKEWLLKLEIINTTEIKEHRKPTHGSCCTCQECGYFYDDCVCENNKILKEIADLAHALVGKV